MTLFRALSHPSIGRVMLVIALVVASAVAVGCGKSRKLSALTGKVTYKGKPLQFGTVIMQTGSNQPAIGEIQPDGTFVMVTRGEGDGAPVGMNQVRVMCFEGQNPKNSPSQNSTGKSSEGEGVSGSEFTLGRELIPKKYMSYTTSGITVDVKPGANEPLVIELTN